MARGGANGGFGSGKKNTAPTLADYSIDAQENTNFSLRIKGTDPDRQEILIYSFVNPISGVGALRYTAPDGVVFFINPITGRVTADRAFNYEITPSYQLAVRVTDRAGATDTATVTINVSDRDEFDVTAAVDVDSAPNTVLEGAAAGTLVGITAFASDADGSNNIVAYSLVSDAAGTTALTDGPFQIDPATGVVSVRDGTQLDHEADPTLTIFVKATSSDGSTAVEQFDVSVSDRDEFDVTAAVDVDSAPNTVLEGAAAGTLVGITAFASDADGSNNIVAYSLVSDAAGTTALTDGPFQIDPATGVVSVRDGTQLDHEADPTLTIFVKATSSDGSTAVEQFDVSVSDRDEFDVTAAVDVDSAPNTVLEGAAAGTLVGITAFASDADGSNNIVAYSLVSDAAGTTALTDGPFQIDPATGVVSVRDGTQLDHEADPTLTIFVKATSSDGSTAVEQFDVSVSDRDEFDVTAAVDVDSAPNTVLEGAAAGTLVGITAFASDADGSNNIVAYSLVSDAAGTTALTDGPFQIDPATGVVSVRDGTQLDHEADPTLTIFVKATSSDGSTAVEQFDVSVSDRDEFDVTAAVDVDSAPNTVLEGAAAGTLVGITAFASDADGSNNIVAYSLVSDAAGTTALTDGPFQIDPATGMVSVRDGTQLDHEADPTLTIFVKATSSDGSTAVEQFDVSVSDRDEFDVTAAVDVDSAPNTVLEGAAAGTLVGITAFASDADGSNNIVAYSLVSDAAGTTALTDGPFQIDPATGMVSVRDGTQLDHEANPILPIFVKSTSSDGSSSVSDFSIQVEGSPDGLLELNGHFYQVVYVPSIERSAARSLADSASFQFGGITYDGRLLTLNSSEEAALIENAILASNGGQYYGPGNASFWMGGEYIGGEWLWTEGEDSGNSFTFTDWRSGEEGQGTQEPYVVLNMWEGAGGTWDSYSADLTFYMAGYIVEYSASDLDQFDVTAAVDVDSAPNRVLEGAAAGTLVGITAFASDADGSNNAVTYALVSDATGTTALADGPFQIDSATGAVSVRDGTLLDHEALASQTLFVKSTSSDGSSSVSDFSIQVEGLPDGLLESNGHFYQVVYASSIERSEAKSLSDSASFQFGGITYNGHLVTMTTSEEEELIENAILASNGGQYYGPGNASFWMGGEYTGGEWLWTEGENSGNSFDFTDWRSGEEAQGTQEPYVVLNMWEGASGTWDSYSADLTIYIAGYIVEYSGIM